MSLHRFATAIAVLTFILLLMGGLVHNTRSSLACPDWPLCFGSAFPKMEGGVLIEHSHRLVATTVGLLTTVLMVLLWRRARRTGDRAVGLLGTAALACVVLQGVLGGLTVLYRLPTLVSTAHLAVSMIFFCLLIYLAFRLRSPLSMPRRPLPQRVRRWTAIAAVAVYLQMILGALMRHLGAGLACTELPLCQGRWWPSGAHPNVLLHVTHRLLALLVLAIVLQTSQVVWRSAPTWRAVRVLAAAGPLLALAQITLGVFSITTFLAVAPVTAHLAGAALLLGDLVALHLIARGELAPAASRRSIDSRTVAGVAA